MAVPAVTAGRAQPELLMPQAVLTRTAERLAEQFAGVFSVQTVERYVFESYTALHRTAAVHTHHAAGRVHVRSAGSSPTGTINPVVVQVMAEAGLELVREFPKPLTDDVVAAADCVVTMGCGDACPVYPGKRYLDRSLTDPDGADVDTVRAVRDDLDRRVQDLLALITTQPGAAS